MEAGADARTDTPKAICPINFFHFFKVGGIRKCLLVTLDVYKHFAPDKTAPEEVVLGSTLLLHSICASRGRGRGSRTPLAIGFLRHSGTDTLNSGSYDPVKYVDD